jgi:DNA-binding FadR family transcriptional regulator
MRSPRHLPEQGLRLNQSLAREIGTAILTGKYAPGDNLGGEIESSEALGVSRSVYREAMRILIAKGLVASRPKAGTHVTAREQWNRLDPEVLAWTFSSEPDPRAIQDIFELRRIIEPAAAGLAAQRRSEAQLAAMAAALAAMRDKGLQSEEGKLADQDFHRLILAAAANDALYSLASSVGAAVTWTTRFKQRRHRLPRDPLPDHIAVFDAIRAGSAKKASAAMQELLILALADMGDMA